jgi:hypothetical protein
MQGKGIYFFNGCIICKALEFDTSLAADVREFEEFGIASGTTAIVGHNTQFCGTIPDVIKNMANARLLVRTILELQMLDSGWEGTEYLSTGHFHIFELL